MVSLVVGRRSQGEGQVGKVGIGAVEAAIAILEDQAVLFQSRQVDITRLIGSGIHADEGAHATAGTAGSDAHQSLGCFGVEVGWIIGDHQQAEGFSDFAGIFVVRFDARVLVPQVLLDDAFHVAGEIDQPLFEVMLFGPDAVGDECFIVISQVHEGGEVVAQPDRIEHGQPGFAGGELGQEAQGQLLQGFDGWLLAGAVCLQEDVATGGEWGQGGRVSSKAGSTCSSSSMGMPPGIW